MIKLAIIGYGKMGKMIEKIIDPNEYELTGIFDVINPPREHLIKDTDVAIEFSTPLSIIDNVDFLASRGINIVCGTGWYKKLDEVKAIIDKYNTGFIYASNFSLGVNLFFQIVKNAAKLINNYNNYDIKMEETHHTQKLDKPSGTAIRLTEFVLAEIQRKSKISSDLKNPGDEELNIISKRIDNIVGNHKVIFESEADSIVLEHNANSRRGFAEGALLAAKFIKNKKGFFKFEDIFNNLA
jgi:4-hydroxy-tetrahydrodipicolinate reductase